MQLVHFLLKLFKGDSKRRLSVVPQAERFISEGRGHPVLAGHMKQFVLPFSQLFHLLVVHQA